ncbi:MAG TPA: L-threonylcarbamoyladenylate synthase [Candidatus Sumerlaeota bacterium]|nr:L-threonylcarbamoyladenylate synthase [Candidatus Sumerlaeota bacterium]
MARARYLTIRSDHPEFHRVGRVVSLLEQGGVVLIPTDTVHALVCDPRRKEALARLRQIKPSLGDRPLTLLTRDLSVASRYAYLDDAAFKFIKGLTPGPYAFLLKGTKEVPRLVLDPKRKQAGIRIPASPLCRALLEGLGGLLVSTSATLEAGAAPASHWDVFEEYENKVDLIVDDEGELGTVPSTIIDMVSVPYRIAREGRGMAALAPIMA